jgi:hypothetical protein
MSKQRSDAGKQEVKGFPLSGEVFMRRSNLIESPARASPTEALIIMGAVAAFSVSTGVPDAVAAWAAAVLVLLTATALNASELQALHLTLFCTFWVLLPQVVGGFSGWPLHKVAPLTAYFAVVAATSCLRRTLSWLRPGSFGPDIRLFVLIVVVISSGVLLLWYLSVNPDTTVYAANVPAMPLWLLPLACLAFSTVNAAVEEAVYRGVFLQALDSALGTGHASVLVQAGVFGWMHHTEIGFPKGASGAVLAFLYGIILGVLRRRARGMLAPWLAHAGTDAAIFVIVVACTG